MMINRPGWGSVAREDARGERRFVDTIDCINPSL